MKLLLDTHIILWALTNDKKLPKQAALLISDKDNQIFFSAASAWEVSIKHSVHPDKMFISGSEFMNYCGNAGYIELSVMGRHVKALETLHRSNHAAAHNDPFDRIMLAQAKADNMLFITHDSLIPGYDEACILFV